MDIKKFKRIKCIRCGCPEASHQNGVKFLCESCHDRELELYVKDKYKTVLDNVYPKKEDNERNKAYNAIRNSIKESVEDYLDNLDEDIENVTGYEIVDLLKKEVLKGIRNEGK